MKIQDYKRKTEKIYRTPKSVQELIAIYRISEDGIFELENKPEVAKSFMTVCIYSQISIIPQWRKKHKYTTISIENG